MHGSNGDIITFPEISRCAVVLLLNINIKSVKSYRFRKFNKILVLITCFKVIVVRLVKQLVLKTTFLTIAVIFDNYRINIIICSCIDKICGRYFKLNAGSCNICCFLTVVNRRSLSGKLFYKGLEVVRPHKYEFEHSHCVIEGFKVGINGIVKSAAVIVVDNTAERASAK